MIFCDCSKRIGLVRGQAFRVAELKAELAELVAAGDEYHAAGVREDIVAAESLARLCHTHTWAVVGHLDGPRSTLVVHVDSAGGSVAIAHDKGWGVSHTRLVD